MKKDVMNLKENKKRVVGRLGWRKWKREMLHFNYLKSYCIYFFWWWLPQQASGSQKIGVGSVSPHGFQGPNSGCSTLQQMPLHTESFHQTPK